jgi:hypothetical protein
VLNILPRVTGIFVARHLKISYSAALDLAYIAFWNGLKLRLRTTSPVRTAGARALTLRDGGLPVRLDRDYSGITVKIFEDGGARKSFSDLGDMREVLGKVRTVVENYQRPRRSWWAVVPADQYSFTEFL